MITVILEVSVNTGLQATLADISALARKFYLRTQVSPEDLF